MPCKTHAYLLPDWARKRRKKRGNYKNLPFIFDCPAFRRAENKTADDQYRRLFSALPPLIRSVLRLVRARQFLHWAHPKPGFSATGFVWIVLDVRTIIVS